MQTVFLSRTPSVGQAVSHYSVVLFVLAFGAAKFTAAEAEAIHPLLVNSPFLFWLPRLFDLRASSEVIGVVEVALALMMASRPFTPLICAIGSYGVVVSLAITLSFLVTTPNIDPALSAFIVKDLTLLGVALWSAGEASQAAKSRSMSRYRMSMAAAARCRFLQPNSSDRRP